MRKKLIRKFFFSYFLKFFNAHDRIDFLSNNSDEDILADSDSDNELQEDILMNRDDAPAERPKKKARGKQEKYIYENSDTIVDLADIKAMSSIASKNELFLERLSFESINSMESFIYSKKTCERNRRRGW